MAKNKDNTILIVGGVTVAAIAMATIAKSSAQRAYYENQTAQDCNRRLGCLFFSNLDGLGSLFGDIWSSINPASNLLGKAIDEEDKRRKTPEEFKQKALERVNQNS